MIKRLLQFFLFLSVCISAHGQASGLADLKFGRAQIADSQWNVQACTQTATCQIYSKNPGTVYKIPWTTGQLAWTTGDYVAFVPTGNSTNPFNAIQYSSNGTQKAVMGTGRIINMGTDYFFFVGNDNNTGQLFSMTQGFANTSGVTWTGTVNPTIAQVNTYAQGGSTTPLAAGQTAPPPVTYTTTYSTQTTSKQFGNRTINYNIPVKNVRNNSTNAVTTTPVTPATLPSNPVSVVSYTGGGGWQIKTYTYTASTTGTGYLMLAFRHDVNYWVIDNVSVKANNTGANLLVNGGLEQSGMMTVNVGGVEQTVAAPTAWGLAYQTNQSPTLGGGFDSGMWYDTSTGSYGSIYQNINFTAGVTYTISFMVASDYNSNGDTVQMAVYAGACDGSGSGCILPASTGMTSAVTPSQTYTVGCAPNCPVNSTPQGPSYPSYVTVSSGTAGTMEFGTNADITTPQQTRVTTWTNKTIPNGNSIYIDQVSGSGNTVTMEQDGNKNKIDATLDGSTNTITVKQGTPGIGQNEIKLGVTGSYNALDISQARNDQGLVTGTNGQYHDVVINGSNNTVTARQSNTGGVGGHYAETTINGNQNNVTKKQTDNGNKMMFTTVTGNNNTVDAVQKGTGQHYLDTAITGNNNSLTAVQEGSIANKATIDMTNAGGPASVILNQIGGQNVTVTTTCATSGGCAPITVRQGY